MALTSVKEMFPGLMRSLSLTPDHFAVISAVERELSPLGAGIQVVGFKRNKVYVEAESPVQLAELSFRKREILKVVRAALPKGGSGAEPEIKFFLKGSARPTKMEALQNRPYIKPVARAARYGG